MRDEISDDLLTRYLLGEVNPIERDVVECAMELDSAFREEVEALLSLSLDLDDPKPIDAEETVVLRLAALLPSENDLFVSASEISPDLVARYVLDTVTPLEREVVEASVELSDAFRREVADTRSLPFLEESPAAVPLPSFLLPPIQPRLTFAGWLRERFAFSNAWAPMTAGVLATSMAFFLITKVPAWQHSNNTDNETRPVVIVPDRGNKNPGEQNRKHSTKVATNKTSEKNSLGYPEKNSTAESSDPRKRNDINEDSTPNLIQTQIDSMRQLSASGQDALSINEHDIDKLYIPEEQNEFISRESRYFRSIDDIYKIEDEILNPENIVLEPMSPVDTNIMERRPTLAWKSIPGIERYLLFLWDVSAQRYVDDMGGATGESFSAPANPSPIISINLKADLIPGHVYEWWVQAFKPSASKPFAQTPTPLPRFKVNDNHFSEELNLNKLKFKLYSAYKYAKYGFFEDAVKQLDAIIDTEYLRDDEKKIQKIAVKLKDKINHLRELKEFDDLRFTPAIPKSRPEGDDPEQHGKPAWMGAAANPQGKPTTSKSGPSSPHRSEERKLGKSSRVGGHVLNKPTSSYPRTSPASARNPRLKNKDVKTKKS